MTILRITLVVICFFASGPAAAKRKIYVFDYQKGDSLPVGDVLLPNRVHFMLSERLDTWIVVKTNDVGDIAEPIRAMQPGTVVLGTYFGAPSPKEHFILTSAGSFKPTTQPLHEELLVLARTPFWRTTEIRRLPSGP